MVKGKEWLQRAKTKCRHFGEAVCGNPEGCVKLIVGFRTRMVNLIRLPSLPSLFAIAAGRSSGRGRQPISAGSRAKRVRRWGNLVLLEDSEIGSGSELVEVASV